MVKRDARSIVSDILDRVSNGKTKRMAIEEVVYVIGMARAQKDMGGVASVFTDCGDCSQHLASCLRAIGENGLAAVWSRACGQLERRGFLAAGKWPGPAPDVEQHQALFDKLEERLDEQLWGLDEKIVAAFPEVTSSRR